MTVFQVPMAPAADNQWRPVAVTQDARSRQSGVDGADDKREWNWAEDAVENVLGNWGRKRWYNEPHPPAKMGMCFRQN